MHKEFQEALQPFGSNKKYSDNQFGSVVKKWNGNDLTGVAIALVGVSNLDGDTRSIHAIRTSLYKLYVNDNKWFVTDLGNLISINQEERTKYLQQILHLLISNGVIPIVLSEDLEPTGTLGKILYGLVNRPVATSSISPTIQKVEKVICSRMYEKYIDYKYALGSQIYLCDNVENRTNLTENIRLGKLRQDLDECEPLFRGSEILSLDMNTVRYADFQSNKEPMPNGLYAEEICQLAWLAGNSDTISALHMYGYFFSKINGEVGAALSAQVLWHFIHGVSNRNYENPSTSLNGFKEVYVDNDYFDEHVVFYQSRRSRRFWCKIPGFTQFIPCNKKDMDLLMQGEIPDRIFQHIKK